MCYTKIMLKNIFSYDDFLKFKDVPRGTFKKLEEFVELLKKWQKTINLVSDSSIPDVWSRHIIDSAQLLEHIAIEENIIDIGSGAGFPGIILAILGAKNVSLVESDARKVAFLKEAARVCGVSVTAFCQRVEEMNLETYQTITARGFASVEKTLNIMENAITPKHKLLLLKGKNFEAEKAEALVNWSFDCQTSPSITDETGVIALITNIEKRR